MSKYMINRTPAKPSHNEIFGKDRLSYGDPKEFGVRVLEEPEE